MSGDNPSKEEVSLLNKQIEEYLKNEKKNFEEYKKEPKLLLLGASDSGKSTLLKQLKIIHGGGFSERERISGKKKIVSNILLAAIRLISMIDNFEDREISQVLYE